MKRSLYLVGRRNRLHLWQMENSSSEQETEAARSYTPVHMDVDHAELMQDARWTRTQYADSSEATETAPNTDERQLSVMESNPSKHSHC